MTLRVGSLCSGYGGIELALKMEFGETELVFVSEFEKDPSKILQYHYPDVPNIGDLTKVDWEKQEKIDILCAGFPCQPFSLAGLRKGEEDERAIFSHILDAISVLRPRFILLENVAGILTLGGPGCIAGLTKAGYDTRWMLVPASDSGACHRRTRWFCVAEPSESGDNANTTSSNELGYVGPSKSSSVWSSTESGEHHLQTSANTNNRDNNGSKCGLEETVDTTSPVSFSSSESLAAAEREQHETLVGAQGETSANTNNSRSKDSGSKSGLEEQVGESSSVNWYGPYEPAIRQWERVLGRGAPHPTDTRGVRPEFVEWMMGLPEGWVTSSEIGVSRSGQLKALGNGVVPQQARLAIQRLGLTKERVYGNE